MNFAEKYSQNYCFPVAGVNEPLTHRWKVVIVGQQVAPIRGRLANMISGIFGRFRENVLIIQLALRWNFHPRAE